jgi:hypothetical protein
VVHSPPRLCCLALLVACNGPHLAATDRVFDLDAWAREPDAAVSPDAAVPIEPDALPPASADAGADLPANAPGEAGIPGCAFCYSDQYCLDGVCTSKPQPIAPAPPACAHPPCINVVNNCPIPLWTHAIGTVPLDDGNVRRLDPGQHHQYAGLPLFGGGRLYAYYQEPAIKQDRVRLVSDHNQFVEMTVDTDATGAFAQNYNISYVDYASLPVSMKAEGAACRDTRCGMPFDHWTALLRTCPTELRNLHQGLGTCTGSYGHCITGDHDQALPYCRKMRDAHGFPGSAVYGGVFPDHPASDVAFWDQVAAWNRGTTAGDSDERRYYRTEPFNHYARFIHQELACLDVYAFSTDDHQDKAGFVRCVSPVLNVVWCPYDRGGLVP